MSGTYDRWYSGCGAGSFAIVACAVVAQLSCADAPADPPTFRLEFDSGLVVEPQTGVFRETRPSSPDVWLTYPEAAIVFQSGPKAPDSRQIRVFNVPVDGNLLIGEARYRDGSDRASCTGAPEDAVDCSEASDPLCRAVTENRSVGADTTVSLTADLPPCATIRVRYQFADDSLPTSIGLVGPSNRVEGLGETVEHRASRTRLTIVTGDLIGSRDDESLAALARELSGLDEPVVVLPGEREQTYASIRQFRGTFGPTVYRWTLGPIAMVVFPTPNRTLADSEPEALDARLEQIGFDTPIVAITHTPPVDPVGTRDRGFRSRTEGMRVMSILSDYRADGLLAGHLGTRHDRSYGNLRMVSAPGAEDGRKLILDWSRPSSGGAGDVEADVREVRR